MTPKQFLVGSLKEGAIVVGGSVVAALFFIYVAPQLRNWIAENVPSKAIVP